MAVRTLMHGMGLRFRLHDRALPGTPDLVLAKHRTAVFVHGCFWHRHRACKLTTTPSTNAEFWKQKFDRNVRRDRANYASLKASGWRVICVWECELDHPQKLRRRIASLFACASRKRDN